MPFFRKKPVVISAEQWWPLLEIEGVVTHYDEKLDGVTGPVPVPFVRTLEGNHFVSPGDWIITGVKGEKYPCKPDIFDMTYESVTGRGD